MYSFLGAAEALI